MKFGWQLFAFLTVFYIVVDLVYWLLGGEIVGITAMGLSAGLALIIAFYFWFTQRRIGDNLPEDRVDGDIADGAGELGFFSPYSWWPLAVGFTSTLTALGLIIGWWLFLIGVGTLVVSIMGFVLEYERPEYQSEH
ncbi:MAG: cytochrome c oxidase subunit 4 [Actinobacteria bacterium]|nr:cytochrome c oxidase subunit 4 [Actinomycetota bacterium]MDA2985322.1 cytochrome c oxidase subunit 4 [Actinomycetota bacterium]